jgi:hypothetical protein
MTRSKQNKNIFESHIRKKEKAGKHEGGNENLNGQMDESKKKREI